jgi:hypothetical protein
MAFSLLTACRPRHRIDVAMRRVDHRRMKRLSLVIETSNPPDTTAGYIVYNEIGQENLAFFANHSFQPDTALTLTYEPTPGDEQKIQVQITHVHEQLAPGRIMQTLPTEENPFPSRKFYRCFANRVKAAVHLSVVPDEVSGDATAATPTIDAPTGEAVTELPVAAVDEAQAA